MPIELIPNQRFIFDAVYDDCATERYCQLLADSDEIKIQFRQTPCGESVVCNSGFDWGYGLELVTDPNFAGCPALPAWTLANGAACSGAAVLFNSSQAAGLCQQTVVGLTVGSYYFFTVTITTMTTGTVRVALGSSVLQAITSPGVYTFSGICTGSNLFRITSELSNATLSTASIKPISIACWSVSGSYFNFDSGFAGVSKVAGGTGTFTQSGYLTSGEYYKVIITIANRTAGNITITSGGNISDEITGNGDQTIYIYADGTGLVINFSEDFDGSVVELLAYELESGFQFLLYDLDGNIISDLGDNGDVVYKNEYVMLDVFFTQGQLLDTGDSPVEYGCYKIGIVDPCSNVEQVCDFSFFPYGGYTECLNGWNLTDGATLLDGRLIIVDSVTEDVPGATQYLTLLPNVCYRLCYSVVSIVKTTVTISLDSGRNNSFTITIPTGTTGEHCVEFTMPLGADSLSIFIANNADADAKLNYVSIKPCAEYLSNCLNWQEEHSGSVLVTGDSEEDYSLGFQFNMGRRARHFMLMNRLFLKINTPTYPIDEEDYLFSSGMRSLTYGMSEKYFNCFFYAVDEITHDNIRAMIISDHFVINSIEYLAKKSDYKPEWDRKGERALVESRIEIKKKSETLFNKND